MPSAATEHDEHDEHDERHERHEHAMQRGRHEHAMHDEDDDGADVVPLRRDRPATTEERPLREVIGEVLRDERLGQQRTLAEVAAAAHVSLPYLSEVERGRKDPSSDIVAAVAAALELPLPTVLDRCADRLRAGAQRGRFLLLAA